MNDGAQFITCDDGCRLHYRLDGPDGAPIVVLSNSLGTAMSMWDGQIGPLSCRYRLLRYDQRGHGQSDAIPGAYSLDRLGRDVIQLIDALGLERVHFCGLSLGGMTGQWLGCRAPERLLSLTLANTSAYMGPPSGWAGRIQDVLAGGMDAMVDAVLERWFTAGFRERETAQVQRIADLLLATDPRGYAGCCAAIRDMDLRPTAGLIDVPTLVIAGSHDPATPSEHAEFLATNIQAARLAHLNAAHLSNIEQSESFAGLVLEFLEEL
jgi:3-oxoadipate enol-lactonase